MTAQEIQALINAKIAGQGSAVDVGGALPQILSGILELAQAGGDATKPIILSGVPQIDDTLENLYGYGLTLQEIEAASKGKRSCVLAKYFGRDAYFLITQADYTNAGRWKIAFEEYSRESNGSLFSVSSFLVMYQEEELTIEVYEM